MKRSERIFVRNLKINDETRKKIQDSGFETTVELAGELFGRRGEFEINKYYDFADHIKASEKDFLVIQKAIYDSGEYIDREGRNVSPIVKYIHVVDQNPAWVRNGAPFRSVVELDRFKEYASVKHYDSNQHIISESKIYYCEYESESFFRALELADWDGWDHVDQDYRLDSPSQSVYVKWSNGKKIDKRRFFELPIGSSRYIRELEEIIKSGYQYFPQI